jgi:transcriptional regulator with XRE-family HTH domain
VKFPAIRTLDTSKTPKAGETRINAPVLASADLAKITKQIQAIQAAQVVNAKRPKKASAKPSLVSTRTKPAKAPKEVIAIAPAQLGTAILAARTAAKLSQTTLAARLKTSQASIVRLEKGRSVPTTRTLQRIAKATGHELVITCSPARPNWTEAVRFQQRTSLYFRERCPRDGRPEGYGAHTMPKEIKNKREEKKKPAMTPKEKKAAKHSKKEAGKSA